MKSFHESPHRTSYQHFHHRRPDWWPENESWPPDRRHWRDMRHRFARGIGCLLGLVTALALFVVAILSALVANGLGLVHFPTNFIWIIPVVIILIVFGLGSLALVGRRLWRLSAPLGDLLDATGRIAEGDYSARIREKGIPEMRNLARAFNSMATRLESASEQRRDLLADVTHELRTPLTVIRGNLEGMLDGVYAPDEVHLKSLLEETQLLDRLVEDLRTLALAESGALQLRKEPTDLGMLITETVSGFRAQANLAHVSIDLDLKTDLPSLDLDPERIRQVLSNLIANALRYTPSDGTIQVQYSLDETKQGKQALVTVADNGAGIPADILPHIFERFYKSRDSSGTGLGLPIAKYLVEAHGGTISAESAQGKGTTICIMLPIGE
jgi:signal transduction histidine kinase